MASMTAHDWELNQDALCAGTIRVLSQPGMHCPQQGTKVEGTIARLFEGHMHMFIECINVDVKSTRRESYMDLQLDVKGAKNIYESFDKYCEVEVMDGANQYKTDEHGLQVGHEKPFLATAHSGSAWHPSGWHGTSRMAHLVAHGRAFGHASV